MSNERYGDTDLVYWMGRSINAMTREELQVALGDAMMQIEYFKKSNDYKKNYVAFLEMRIKDELHDSCSRFTNPDYITSFC
jgi:hypothetical protein